MRVIITDKNVGDWAAAYVAKKINEFKPTKERPFVLGLPTGGTPLEMYKRLIQLNKDRIVDSGSIRSAYGFSIAWQSPMGPLSFDFSKVLKKEYYDESQNFTFSFGSTF